MEHPDDVIVCCKQHWSDMCLSQPPFLALPHAHLTKLLGDGPTEPLPRNKLSARHLAEYKKSATKVGEMPWNMQAAKDYLQTWCRQNESGSWPAPHPLGWVVSPATSHPVWRHQQLEPSEEWVKYAPGRPAHMQIAAVRKQRVEPNVLVGASDAPQAPPERKAPRAVVPSRKRHVEPSVAVRDSDEPQAPPEPEAPRALGCPKCRMSVRGCVQCRNPTYRMRSVRPRKSLGAP